MEQTNMVIKAQSPAGFAEEFLIESIWNNRFPPGSILPAERELSDLIGVTRTTLREVLQRLARDGWLKIQHGKPTRVNNVWETSGLNILETLARLDHDSVPQLIDNLLSVRTNIAAIFIRLAVSLYPDKAQAVLSQAAAVDDKAEADKADAFTELDYRIFHGLAFASGNPIYGLIFNGLKGLYLRAGRYYFTNPQARELARNFYSQLATLCRAGCMIRSWSWCAATVKRAGISGAPCNPRCLKISWGFDLDEGAALGRAAALRKASERRLARRTTFDKLDIALVVHLLHIDVKAP